MASLNQILSECTMLVVEDNAVVRYFLMETLGKKYPALTLYEADNGRRGFELFCEVRPEIVFTDLMMPEMDGIGMVRRIRELAPRTEIMVGTAHSETDLLLECISIGVTRYLLKPFGKELLFEAMDDCLGRIQLERKVKSQQEELCRHRDHLESLVGERTAELELRNRQLEVEIAERKRAEELLRLAEQARTATVEILQICNSAEGSLPLARQLTRFFQQLTGCDAVGIRLKDGEDYPYYESRGFSEEFLLVETSVCTAGAGAPRVREVEERPELECLCGLVLTGRIDPALPGCSAQGSFWTGLGDELAAQLARRAGSGRMRYRCLEEGYQSVALIPLRSQGEIFGLLQLNSRTPERFDREKVLFLEGLASYAAIALAKRQTDEVLRRSERALCEAQEIGRVASYFYDLGRDRWTGSALLDAIYGIEPQYERTLAGWGELVHPSQRDAVLEYLHDCITRRRRFDREFPIVRPLDGAERWVHGVGEAEYGADGAPLRLAGTVQDVTERKRAEQEVFRYARRLIQVEEELRKRIAMELHDDIAQELAALGLNLSLIERTLPPQPQGTLLDRLSESRTLTKEIGRRVRDLMADLRPVQLEEYGLAPSVQGHAELFANRTGIQVEVLADPEFPRLPVLKEISLFRIVQEALSNVARHAEASRVLILMDRDPDSVSLAIADDGKGFSPQRLSPPNARCGWGLANMRERAEMIGAVFRVDSFPSAGTTISVELKEGR